VTAKFAVRAMLGALILLVASSSAGQAQKIVNLSPAPVPQVNGFHPGEPIIVSGGTNPAAAFVTIKASWLQNTSNRLLSPNGDFTTHFPGTPAGTSTILAPAAPGQYSITVRALNVNGVDTDAKTIQITVVAP